MTRFLTLIVTGFALVAIAVILVAIAAIAGGFKIIEAVGLTPIESVMVMGVIVATVFLLLLAVCAQQQLRRMTT